MDKMPKPKQLLGQDGRLERRVGRIQGKSWSGRHRRGDSLWHQQLCSKPLLKRQEKVSRKTTRRPVPRCLNHQDCSPTRMEKTCPSTAEAVAGVQISRKSSLGKETFQSSCERVVIDETCRTWRKSRRFWSTINPCKKIMNMDTSYKSSGFNRKAFVQML